MEKVEWFLVRQILFTTFGQDTRLPESSILFVYMLDETNEINKLI